MGTKAKYESDAKPFFKVALDLDKTIQGKEHDNSVLNSLFMELGIVVNASRAAVDLSYEMAEDLAQDQLNLPDHIKFFNASNALRLCNEQMEAIEKCLYSCADIYDNLGIKERRAGDDSGSLSSPQMNEIANKELKKTLAESLEKCKEDLRWYDKGKKRSGFDEAKSESFYALAERMAVRGIEALNRGSIALARIYGAEYSRLCGAAENIED
jgi:hypothetical protein